MQGHTYFVQRLHRRGGATARPVNVHVTYSYAGDAGKRLRLQTAGHWLAEAEEYYADGEFIRVTGVEDAIGALLDQLDEDARLPESAWRCEEDDRRSSFPGRPCFHPRELPRLGRRGGGAAAVTGGALTAADAPTIDGGVDLELALDPAMPHVSAQLQQRRFIRNALAIARASGRILILPRLWCLCDRCAVRPVRTGIAHAGPIADGGGGDGAGTGGS